MNGYAYVVAQLAKMESIKTEVEGFKSYNDSRLSMGYAPAYKDRDFFRLSAKLDKIADDLLDFAEKG